MHKGTSFKGYLRKNLHHRLFIVIIGILFVQPSEGLTHFSIALKGEQVDPSSHGDLHEAFDIGSDNQSFSDGKITSGNQFPPEEDLPNFKSALMAAW